jgi:hypothetical protein
MLDYKNALELKTKPTFDCWGHEGVCSYYRLTEWSNGGGQWTEWWAEIYVSDTSSGHGWEGRMSKTEWEKIGVKK